MLLTPGATPQSMTAVTPPSRPTPSASPSGAPGGQSRPGKLADVTVLSKDILTTVGELFVRCAKTGQLGLTYRQALDEAFCLGWIDGVRHALDEKLLELQAEGRVEEAGLGAYEARVKSQHTFESRPRSLAPAFIPRFRLHRRAWEFFEAQPLW